MRVEPGAILFAAGVCALLLGLVTGRPVAGCVVGVALFGLRAATTRGGRTLAVVGPSPLGAALAGAWRVLALPVVRAWGRSKQLVHTGDPAWEALLDRVRDRVNRGRVTVILGITTGTHEASVAVVRLDEEGCKLVASFEEERFNRIKHTPRFPTGALVEALRVVTAMGVPYDEVEVVGSWDYGRFAVEWGAHLLEGLPHGLPNLLRDLRGSRDSSVGDGLVHIPSILGAPDRIAAALGCPVRPLVGLPHHDNHAWGSWSLSPFFGEDTLVLVVDGMGDQASASAYRGRGRTLEQLDVHAGFTDSLGLLYQAISAGQGGWTPLSSEGRFMGASAWGDRDRRTNGVYRAMRGLLHLGPDGEVSVNRMAARWMHDRAHPYGGVLADALTAPVPIDQRWNPDAVLDPEAVEHPDLTRARLDEAAALQLLFEDAITHLVDHLVRTTGVSKLVWTGGTALNCVASLHLLETFDRAWFRRTLDREALLELWVPPFPADAGVAAGAALQVARHLDADGPAAVRPLVHAFLNGPIPTSAVIREALQGAEGIAFETLPEETDLAEWLAERVADGQILGVYQGAAEAGPRALGHRSIVADATDPTIRDRINAHVKRREAVRPLAPMVTREAAEALFELQPGAAARDHAAYDFMVQCVRARPVAHERIPAVVHRDGSSRIQIVRPSVDPLMHRFLQALGRRTGVEVSVNTSLNVGEPIAHSPEDALRTLLRAKDLHGLLLVGDDGTGFVARRHRDGALDPG